VTGATDLCLPILSSWEVFILSFFLVWPYRLSPGGDSLGIARVWHFLLLTMLDLSQPTEHEG
jgi:hypothetical protein